MTKLDMLVDLTREIRDVLRPVLDDSKLEVVLRKAMEVFLDVALEEVLKEDQKS